ncbi:unnamed protein product [Adineta ricciae]|uniref:Uncharacterized protein n=1 Tax=Adineta ricciae TaxID=249248 RepID=A0A815R949_ADIRI|nr:unnamed protein product [Adineta ricciae]
MFIDNEKKLAKIKRRLYIDCMTRWNSTLVALQSLVDHKPVLISLFENKGQLPLTSKQKEKLGLLELSSDDYTIFNILIEIFQPFYHATNLLSASKYPTIGLCLLVIRELKEHLEKEENNDSNLLISLKNFILESFDNYFAENGNQHFLLTFEL